MSFDDVAALKRLRAHFAEKLASPDTPSPYFDDGNYGAPDQQWQTPPSVINEPPAQVYAGGGAVDYMGGPDYEDYGYGRFTRTPAERRNVREERIAQHRPVDDWGSREWERFGSKHNFNPLSYGMEALGRMDSSMRDSNSGQDIRSLLGADHYQRNPSLLNAVVDVGNLMTLGLLPGLGKKMVGAVAPMVYDAASELAPDIFGREEPQGYRTGGVVDIIKSVRDKFGKTQGRRIEQAADLTNLEHYRPESLEWMFDPSKRDTGLLAAIPPGDFENYARPIPPSALDVVPYPRWDRVPKAAGRRIPRDDRNLDSYVGLLQNHIYDKGLTTPPTLWMYRTDDPLTAIEGHEGRHRMRAFDRMGEDRALVNLLPANRGETRGELDEMLPRLQDKYFSRGAGQLVLPEPHDFGAGNRAPLPFYSEPFKSGGAVKFAKKMREWLEPEKAEALDRISKVTDKTKNEALIYGTVGSGDPDPFSKIVRGNATSVDIPEWHTNFSEDARRKGAPWFTAHTHPNDTLSPSHGDLRFWSHNLNNPMEMLIGARPQGSSLELGSLSAADRDFFGRQNIADSILTNKGILNNRPFDAMAQDRLGLLDFTKAHGIDLPRGTPLGRFFSEMESAPTLDYMARRGVPVTMDAEHTIPMTGGAKAEDVFPELMNFYRGKGSKYAPFDLGFDRGGSVLTRLARQVAGKPSRVELPSGAMDAAPIKELEDIGESFSRRQGNPYPIQAYPDFDEDRARRIAEAYETMRHNPANPRVRRSYEALVDETMDQYKELEKLGLNFEAIKPGDNVDDAYRLAYPSIINQGKMKFFPTDQGFGSSPDTANHPLLRNVGRIGDVNDATANDAFRVVHDLYGHFAPGNPFFDNLGEDRAFLNHSRMYSKDALPALASETRGQNSWVTWGPHGEHNRAMWPDRVEDIIYAPQKAGELPEWAYGDAVGYKTGSVVKAAKKAWKTRRAEDLEKEVLELNRGKSKPSDQFTSPDVDRRLQTVDDPQRIMFPGIYKDPRDIVGEAKSRMLPDRGKDSPMFRLFGQTRQSLDELSQGERRFDDFRPGVGFEHPFTPSAAGRGSAISPQILTNRNAGRITDALGEALKDPDLRATRSWYEMTPLWDRATELGVGDQGPFSKRAFNTRLGVMSPASDPTTEIERGVLANYLAHEGRTADFVRYGGVPEHQRGTGTDGSFPPDMMGMKSHAYHRTAQAPNLLDFETTGRLWSKEHKVPTYVAATDPIHPYGERPVADSHFTRFLGYPDVRTGNTLGVLRGNMGNPEYADMFPWWNDKIAGNLDLRPRDAQALMWNVGGPQTGVRYIGPSKLEMISDFMEQSAHRLGVSPETARDLILTGQSPGFAAGGSVDDDMALWGSQNYASGGSIDDDLQKYASMYYSGGGSVPQRSGYFRSC